MHMELVSFDSNIIYIIITLIVTLPKKNSECCCYPKLNQIKALFLCFLNPVYLIYPVIVTLSRSLMSLPVKAN
jgi:hypothetical protein